MISHVLLAVLICISLWESSCFQELPHNINLSVLKTCTIACFHKAFTHYNRLFINFLCVILVENDLLSLFNRSFCLLLRLSSSLNFRLRLLLLDLAGAELDVAVTLHTGTSRDELTDDNILFQTDQVIYFAVDRSLSKNLCGLPGRMQRIRRNRLQGMPL